MQFLRLSVLKSVLCCHLGAILHHSELGVFWFLDFVDDIVVSEPSLLKLVIKQLFALFFSWRNSNMRQLAFRRPWQDFTLTVDAILNLTLNLSWIWF